jgi:hypothetical protein
VKAWGCSLSFGTWFTFLSSVKREM